MTKNEFLSILRDSLAGNVPSDVINENISYYRDYIENNDKAESQVLEELGDPRLIARTIIDSFIAEKGPMADFYTKQARDEYRGNYDNASSYDNNYQLRGRDYVVPGDVKEVFIPTLAHRMILTGRAESQGKTAEQILKAVLDGTPAPRLR